jgi:hypothetical protein
MMRLSFSLIVSITLLCSCKKEAQPYDRELEAFLPLKTQLYYSMQDSVTYEFTVFSIRTYTEEQSISGEKSKPFEIREVITNLPKAKEVSSSFSIGGLVGNSLMIAYKSEKKERETVFISNSYHDDTFQAYLERYEVDTITYKNVMKVRLVRTTGETDVSEIFIAENQGIIQLVYNDGDTLKLVNQ